MNGLSRYARKLWIEGQLQLPFLVPYLHQAKELTWLRPYLTIHRLQGHHGEKPLTVDCVGLNTIPSLLENLFTDYRSTLLRQLFTDEPVAQEIGRLPVWHMSKLNNDTGSDLTIVLGNKHLFRSLDDQNSIVMPLLVEMVLNIQGAWEDVIQRMHKNVRKNQLRLTRKFGYEYEVSHRPEDFELFYYQMYAPTVKLRHGKLASPMSVEEAYQNFRHGCLHLVKRDNQYISGRLAYVHGNMVSSRIIGVLNADAKLIEENVLAGLLHAVIHWANQSGYKYVSLEECAPFLANGLFQFKRGWGSVVKYSDISHQRIWIKVQRNTPAVRQFFKDNPLIIIGKNDRLQGLIVTDNLDSITETKQSEWHKHYATPGLEDLIIRSENDLGQRV